MANKLLLLEDVIGLGRKGEIVGGAKPGFARNFLLPKKKAVYAEAHLVKFQERLQKERAKQAIDDKKDAEELAASLKEQQLKITVKIDAEGHMYGSVSAKDVSTLLKEQLSIELDKRNILLPKAIKKTGLHLIELRLKEGIPAHVNLEIIPEAQQ